MYRMIIADDEFTIRNGLSTIINWRELGFEVVGKFEDGKSLENRPDHRPMLSDLEYNSLLTYPDNIQLLYCDDIYNSSVEKKDVEEIIVAKNILGNSFATEVAVAGNVFANIELNL